MDERHACDDRSTCDAAHSDQRDQSNFGPPLQLQMPDQESRNDSEGEVGDDTEDTVDVAESGDDCVVDALSFLRSAVPHVRDWVALEETNEEESASSNDRNAHGTVDDPGIFSQHCHKSSSLGCLPCVQFSNTNPQEKETDGKLRTYHRYRVEQIAKVPRMLRILNTLDRQVTMMFPGSIVYADARRCGVRNEEELRT